ncbi:MAG: AraC family transcriptional regulator, partial [Myxococcota bacterium]
RESERPSGRSHHLLSLILAEVAEAGIVGPKPTDSLVGRALRFIQRNAFRPLSLSDVAKAVHRSPTHLATTIKRNTGHTVGDWINAQRVSEAARWLSHTDASLDEVAEKVGWRDTTHFIRMFKRRHGVTPAAWRRQHRHPGPR